MISRCELGEIAITQQLSSPGNTTVIRRDSVMLDTYMLELGSARPDLQRRADMGHRIELTGPEPVLLIDS